MQISFLEMRPNGGGGQYKLTLQQPASVETLQSAYTTGCITDAQYNLLAVFFHENKPNFFSFDTVYSKSLTHAQANDLWRSFPQIQANLGKCGGGVAKIEPDYSVLDYIESSGTPQLDAQQIAKTDADNRAQLGLPSLPSFNFTFPDLSQIGTALAVLAGLVGLVVVLAVMR